MDLAGILFQVVSSTLIDWPKSDVERYFRMAYKDIEMSLLVETNSSNAAQIIAKGQSDMMIERMKYLRVREENKLLELKRREIEAKY